MLNDVVQFIDSLGRELNLAGEVVHVERIKSRKASYAELNPPLHPLLKRALKAQGVSKFYSHQAKALELARQGRDIVVATPTASGKTLVYALPVLENLLENPKAKALFLFPLKALEQDQLTALNTISTLSGLGQAAAVYDGDTPPSVRRKLREKPPAILISNPDMIHAGILAYADAWDEFLADLEYVVIDEVHTYRGVFGSHVAQVLRRLLRLAAKRGARPRFILSSATIANPALHARSLTGRNLEDEAVVDRSGAPLAGRHFALVNPQGAASTTAAHVFTRAVKAGLSTICFTKSRLHTELIHSWVANQNPELRNKVAGYRAGFLPGERRIIERDLASGKLSGVVTTSALEMGIDIGELDLCILVGYPGSQINTWQRGGRVGRSGRDSAIVMVAGPDALDQYLINHPGIFFARPVEAAVLDPDNSSIVGRHLTCAAAEEPLTPKEEFFDLDLHSQVVKDLVDQGDLLYDAEGVNLFSARKKPQRFVDLRGAGDSFAIVGPGGRVVGSLDGIRAFKEGYPGAVYLHQTKSYVVKELNLVERKVIALPAQAAYYTRARSDKDTEILEETGRRPVNNFLLRQGRLKVTENITGYERRNLRGGDLLGVFDLDLPPLIFETHGLWLDIEDSVRQVVEKAGYHFMGSIHALEHVAIAMFPLFALCDRADIGGISIPLHHQTKKAAVFIYDGAPGGVGLSERAFEIIEDLLAKVEELLASCPCEEGCPACVYSPKCGAGNKPLDKKGALLLVRTLLGKEDLLQKEAGPAPVIVSSPKDREVKPMELSYGVLDLETQRLANEVGGWKNAHLMRVSVGVLYDSVQDEYFNFPENKVHHLLKRLEPLDMVVGFNIKGFDYSVLSAYTSFDLHRYFTLDLLKDIHAQLGFRLSLQSLGEATFGLGKSADGLMAVEWFRAGEMEKLTEYCRRDVELTRDLFLYGQENGYLLYQRKNGPKLRVPVDWSWESLKKRKKEHRG